MSTALFSTLDDYRQTNAGRLPRIEPHEVPTADTSDYVFGRLTPVLASLLPESKSRHGEITKELLVAGFHNPHAAQNLAAIRYVAIMAPLLFFGTLLVLAPRPLEILFVCLLFIVPVLGWSLPRLHVRGKARDRRSQIDQSMPDLFDMLSMCVSQGLTVSESLKRIIPDLQLSHPALAQELKVVDEQAALSTLEQALENFGERLSDVPEVQSFTTLLIQTERMGTSVANALIEYSDNMRESQRQRADEKANRAAFQLLFPTVFLLMPAVYIFLLGPAIIELSNFFNAGGADSLQSGRNRIVERLERR